MLHVEVDSSAVAGCLIWYMHYINYKSTTVKHQFLVAVKAEWNADKLDPFCTSHRRTGFIVREGRAFHEVPLSIPELQKLQDKS